jgi:hypothetical protein
MLGPLTATAACRSKASVLPKVREIFILNRGVNRTATTEPWYLTAKIRVRFPEESSMSRSGEVPLA